MFLLFFVLCPIPAHAEFVGQVVGVIDGDSVRVMTRARLNGFA
jgi:hypothetical protein